MGLLFTPFRGTPVLLCGVILPAIVTVYFVYAARTHPEGFARRVAIATCALFVLFLAMPSVAFHPLHGIFTVSFPLGALVSAAVIAACRRWGKPGIAVAVAAWVVSSPVFLLIQWTV